MQNNWQTKKLVDVCEVIAGQSPEGRFYNKVGNGLPFYQGKKEFTEITIGKPTTWTTDITKEAKAGDILMSVRAPVGPVNYAAERICIGRGLAAIRAGKEIDRDYLFKFLCKHEAEIVGNAGAVFNSINKTQIEHIQIPLPPLPTQKRIVKKLDKAFAAIEKVKKNAEKNLQNTRELFESYLNNIFANPGKDWEERRLGECLRLQSGDNITRKMMIQDGKFPVYGGNGIAGMYDKFNLTGSNVIIGRVGALCGNVRHITEPIWLTDNGFEITDCNDVFDHAFLACLLNFKNLRSYARQAAQPVISNASLEDVLLQFPKSKIEQKHIVAKLNALSAKTKKLEAIYKQKLADLEELKKSILQKAFKGEL